MKANWYYVIIRFRQNQNLKIKNLRDVINPGGLKNEPRKHKRYEKHEKDFRAFVLKINKLS
ncbi:MAG: hypothetical protein BWK80_03560 [Desulfobacteraceae bacterium IS3]|nr:MAG: hypothetical protein BWK80_03560 [Desulfobacteraceae bacterium IS3]